MWGHLFCDNVTNGPNATPCTQHTNRVHIVKEPDGNQRHSRAMAAHETSDQARVEDVAEDADDIADGQADPVTSPGGLWVDVAINQLPCARPPYDSEWGKDKEGDRHVCQAK